LNAIADCQYQRERSRYGQSSLLGAAVLGFGGVAGTAMAGAQLLFWVAIVLFIISLVAGLFRRGI
jgi:uncharacterized membrane protein YtjA (UPF0391 family)